MLRNWSQVCRLCGFRALPASVFEGRTVHGQEFHGRMRTTVFSGSFIQTGRFLSNSASMKLILRQKSQSVVYQSQSTQFYSTEIRPDWTIHELLMTTCSDMWDHFRAGADFVVSYIDTASQLTKAERNKMPTVLAVARDPFHSNIMKPILEKLAHNGFRIVMPYLPGCKLTRGVTESDEELFSHLLGERSAFLLDFIGCIGVHRFDIAIGHCLECFTLLTLGSNFTIFDKVVFICPIPGHVPPRWIRPLRISLNISDWYKNILMRPVAMLWLNTFVRRHVSTRHAATRDLNLLLQIAFGINYNTVSGMTTMFESRRIPLLYAFCDGDRMVNASLSREYAELFNIDSADVYDANGHLIEKAKVSPGHYTKALQFTAQTHFPQAEAPLCDVLVKEILQLHKDYSADKMRQIRDH